jgi:hypothetical protein
MPETWRLGRRGRFGSADQCQHAEGLDQEVPLGADDPDGGDDDAAGLDGGVPAAEAGEPGGHDVEADLDSTVSGALNPGAYPEGRFTDHDRVAGGGGGFLRGVVAGTARVIRIDAAWSRWNRSTCARAPIRRWRGW